MSIKIMTELDCQTKIKNVEYLLKVTADEKEKQKVKASIMIWERMITHIKEGRTVTLEEKDGEEYLQLEDNIASA